MQLIIHPGVVNFKKCLQLVYIDVTYFDYPARGLVLKIEVVCKSKHNLIAVQDVKTSTHHSKECKSLEPISLFSYCVPVIDVNDLSNRPDYCCT